MHETSSDPVDPPRHYVRPLVDGGTLTVDGSTVPDPETGAPVPATTLRLPEWRLHDLMWSLSLWTAALTLLSRPGWPVETDLCEALAAGAEVLKTT